MNFNNFDCETESWIKGSNLTPLFIKEEIGPDKLNDLSTVT